MDRCVAEWSARGIRATLVLCLTYGRGSMNLTLSLDDDLLKKARRRALEDDTSVNAVVREFLESYVKGEARRQEAISDILELSRKSCSGRGDGRWTRDELHER